MRPSRTPPSPRRRDGSVPITKRRWRRGARTSRPALRTRLARLVGACLVGGIVLAGVLAPVTVGAGALANQVSTTADPISAQLAGRTLAAAGAPLVTTVLDRTGAPMAQLFDQYRLPVSYG